jgi:hypothetical protein
VPSSSSSTPSQGPSSTSSAQRELSRVPNPSSLSSTDVRFPYSSQFKLPHRAGWYRPPSSRKIRAVPSSSPPSPSRSRSVQEAPATSGLLAASRVSGVIGG